MGKIIFVNSSSKANAALVIKGGAGLLIDCGCSMRAIKKALLKNGYTTDIIKAVLVTHSHSDHIKGLPVLRRELDVPFLSGVDIECCQKLDNSMNLHGFDISCFTLSHDVDCVGYRIDFDGKSVAFATDTGVVTGSAKDAFCGVSTLVLESNHDIDMLRFGPYPAALKSRIASDKGHLSNADCAKEVVRLANDGALRTVLLAHLSEHNNTPLVAKKTVCDELIKYGFSQVDVQVAAPDVVIEL